MTHEQKNALVLVTCQYTEAVVTAAVATGTFSPVVVLYCSRSNASFLLFANYLDPQEAKKDNWETCERIFFFSARKSSLFCHICDKAECLKMTQNVSCYFARKNEAFSVLFNHCVEHQRKTDR